tara:strand:- start:1237 stop:1446 length:210 start_codon:yes stop_codon:yes gene_type:complete
MTEAVPSVPPHHPAAGLLLPLFSATNRAESAVVAYIDSSSNSLYLLKKVQGDYIPLEDIPLQDIINRSK